MSTIAEFITGTVDKKLLLICDNWGERPFPGAKPSGFEAQSARDREEPAIKGNFR
jgi:hypothetical protein